MFVEQEKMYAFLRSRVNYFPPDNITLYALPRFQSAVELELLMSFIMQRHTPLVSIQAHAVEPDLRYLNKSQIRAYKVFSVDRDTSDRTVMSTMCGEIRFEFRAQHLAKIDLLREMRGIMESLVDFSSCSVKIIHNHVRDSLEDYANDLTVLENDCQRLQREMPENAEKLLRGAIKQIDEQGTIVQVYLKTHCLGEGERISELVDKDEAEPDFIESIRLLQIQYDDFRP